MSYWDGNTKLYSGQGVVLIGKRTTTGTPRGLLPVGNCSQVKIAVSESLLEHKESQSGSRSVDQVIIQQLKPSVSIDMESLNARNLALALRGDRQDKLAGTVTTEALGGAYAGMVSKAQFLQIASPVLKRGATTLVAFVAEGTPYDYKVNLAAGSVLINDGSTTVVSGLTTGGVAPSVITPGNPTVVTVAVPTLANGLPQVGDKAIFTGFTGADAALLNGKAFEILSFNGPASAPTGVNLNVDTTGKTITLGTPLSFFDGQALTLDYTYSGQSIVNAFTQAIQERWVRFEGLNTVDNNPVVVDMFRMKVSLLNEMSLLGDDIYKFTLDGDLLQDVLQTSGSQYFKETLLVP